MSSTRARARRVGLLASLSLSAALLVACSPSRAEDLVTPSFPIQEIKFTDVTLEAGLTYDNFGCIAFDDFDGDDLPDLLLGPFGEATDDLGINLHRNNGDGTFTTSQLSPVNTALALSCATGDVDGDGILDIVIGHIPTGLTVLMGIGHLEFEELSGALPSVQPDSVHSVGIPAIALFDFDRDGDLDIIGGHTLLPSPRECQFTTNDYGCLPQTPIDWASTFLLRNIDGRSWEAVEPSPGNRDAGSINGIGFIDFDRDGWLDVFMTQDFAANGLYLNKRGTGEFEDITTRQDIAVYNHGMGSAFGDFDRNGHWDIYVADLGPDQFWFGQGSGSMRNEATELGIYGFTKFHSGWSPQAQDFNQDGYLDIFVTNSALVSGAEDLISVSMGESIMDAPTQADFIFTADQNGGYEMSVVPHLDVPESSPRPNGGGTAVADYDGDGDLDLAQFYLSPPTFRLLENQTENAGNWLQAELVPESGYAYGAEVEARVDGALLDRRVLHGSTGSPGKSWEVLHFGLGNLKQIDEFVVWWPGRERQIYRGPFPANQRYVLQQK